MPADLGKAYVQIVPSAKGIASNISNELSGLDGIGEKHGAGIGKGVLSGIGKAFAAGTAALGASLAAVWSTVVSSASDVAQYGDTVDKMSQKMGLSREAYQEWDAVMQHSGTSMESMQASMKTLANAVENGNDAFARIGLSMDEVHSMSNEDLFAATIAGLQQVDNETERTYLAGQLLGRGATELGALLNTSAEDTAAMRERVRELGGVMSDDAVLAAARYQDSLQDMTTAIDGIKRGIAAQFLPGIADMMDGFTSLVAGEEGAEEALSAGFDNILTAIETSGEQFFAIIETIVPKLLDIIIAHLPEVIQGGVTLLLKLGEGIIKSIPDLLAMLPQVINGILNAFRSIDWATLGIQIIQGIINGIAAAASALWETMKNLAASAWRWAQDAFEIGSPSKLFAREIGQYIPAGVAVGIDDNLAPINTSIGNMATTAVDDFGRATAPGMTKNAATAGAGATDIDRLVDAISNRPVIIEGDTSKIFRVVQQENRTRTRATNYNILAAGAR